MRVERTHHSAPQQRIMAMSRIKMFALLPMRKDISRQTFHDHWRHPHGTWARDIASTSRYIQSHRIETAHLGPEQSRYEGVAEVWKEGIEDASTRGLDPVYVKYLIPDEPNFIDKAGLRFVFTDEEIIQSGPPAGTPAESADSRWKERNAALSVKLIQIIEQDGPSHWAMENDRELGCHLGALRHVRSHFNPQLHPVGREPAAIGFRELWWPTLSAFEAGVTRAPEALQTILSRPAKAVAMLCQAERVL
jgi:hypothetical protein